MAHFKGGRGKKVGYETQMYRIPSPMRPVVEKAGLQFRLLWGELTDPTGEKLISRIERAIASPEQLGEDNAPNQISNNTPALVPDIKLTGRSEELGQSIAHSLISGNVLPPLPDIKYQEKELAEAKEKIQLLEQKVSEPNPQLIDLKSQLQTCLAANTTMEQDWTRDRLELEQVKASLSSRESELARLRMQLEEVKAACDAWQKSASQWQRVAEAAAGSNLEEDDIPVFTQTSELGEAFSAQPEDEDVNRLLEPDEEPEETPDPNELGLLNEEDTEEVEEEQDSAPPPTMPKTATTPETEAIPSSLPHKAAIAAGDELTRNQLCEHLNIRPNGKILKEWEDSGKLLRKYGWRRVRGTGKRGDPFIYRYEPQAFEVERVRNSSRFVD